jgi:hypothetical protein
MGNALTSMDPVTVQEGECPIVNLSQRVLHMLEHDYLGLDLIIAGYIESLDCID